MSCKRGKANPDNATKLRLFADSAGYCENPSCLKELFVSIEGENYHFAEMAHIFSAVDGGPRTKTVLSEKERGDYNNLILLCCNCHELIDKAEDRFPDVLIKQWKNEHRERIKGLFSCPVYGTRNEVREALIPLFRENKIIFDTYGPNSEERFNPESSMPREWKNKILTRILPNNRKIMRIIDSNMHLIKPDEIYIIECLRQHIHDFECKHFLDMETSGIKFPIDANRLYEDKNE